MAKYSNTVEYNIRTTLDNSGLTKLTSQIRQVEASLKTIQSQPLLRTSTIDSAIAKLGQVQKVLQNSFNPKLGMMDSKALITGLNNIEGGMKGVYQAFAQGGTQGIKAFNSLYGQVSKLDTGLRQMSSTTDKIMNTLGNTVRWGLIASAFASVMNAAHQAAQYVEDLDRSLTNIMMVSGETRDNMNEFARSANQIAQRLGGTTVQMTEATKVFIQQGYNLDTSAQLGEYAVHLANVSEQDSAMASDEITAYMNAFKIPLDDLGNAISKWAAVANATAVDVEELSIASQKAASVAATVGVDLDQFAGHIAAIESVTREAPENIGNGLKTIYSRIADISLGETLEDGVNLGAFSKALQKVGVDVLDNTGKLRDAGTILEDLMKVWQDLDQTQRAAVAKTVAGRFQLARFEALMNRADIYENAANISRQETDTTTYDRMQETYRNSLEGRTKALTATIEQIFLNAFETDSFYGLIDATTALTQAFADLLKAVGGGGSALTAFSALLLKLFSKNIGVGIGNFISNRQTQQLAVSNKEAAAAQATAMLAQNGIITGNKRTDAVVRDISSVNQYRPQMTPQQQEQANKLIEEQIALVNQEIDLEKQLEATRSAASAISVDATGQEIQTTKELLEYLTQLKLESAEISTQDLTKAGYGQMSQSALRAQEAVSGLRNAIDQIIAAEKKGSGATEELVQAWENFMVAGDKNINILRQAKQALSLTDEQADRLAITFELLTAAQNGDLRDLTALSAALDNAGIDMREFAENIDLAYSGLQIMKDNALGLTNTLSAVRTNIETNSKMFAGMAASQETQKKVTNAAAITGDIAQLAFAWQSFQSLGSLWQNTDIEDGERLKETIMNLAVGLPMLIMGITQLQSAMGLPGIGKGIQNLNNFKNAIKEAQVAQSEATAAAEAARVAKGTAAVGTEALAKAEAAEMAAHQKNATAIAAEQAATNSLKAAKLGLALSIGMVAATAVIIAGTIAWGAYTERIKQAKEAEKEALEATAAHSEEIRSSTKNWENLYKQYQETGKVSEELIDAGNELGDSLDIVGYRAQVTAGKFDSLADAIQRAKDESAQAAITKAQTLLEGQYGDSLAGKEWFNGSAFSDYIQALQDPSNMPDYVTDTGYYVPNSGYEGYAQQFLDNYKLDSNASIGQMIGNAKAARQALEEEAESLRTLNEELEKKGQKESTEYKNNEAKIQQLNDARQQLSKFLTQDDVAAAEEALLTMFENRVSMSDFQAQLSAVGDDAKKIIDIFANDSATRGYFDELTTDAEKYAAALKYVTDEAQRISLTTAYSKAKTEELSSKQLGDFYSAHITSSDYEASFENLVRNTNLSGNNIVQVMIQSAIDQVNSNPELSTEEKEAILSSVDWSGSIEDILTTLTQGAADDASAVLAGYKGMTETKAEAGGRLSSDQLREYDLEQGTVDAYNEQLKSVGALGEQNEYFTGVLKKEQDALDEVKDKFGDTSKEYKEQEEKVKAAQEALNDYNDETEDITAKMIQTQKGLEKLGSEFEKNGEILRQGEKSTLEYAQAMSETKEAVADVLNVEPGSLTNGFIEDHLSEIQSLAEGDLSVLDDLRMAFGQEYLLTLNKQGNLTDAELAQLQADLDNLNLTDVEVGAYVDDDAFVTTLNQMLEDGRLTQEQVNEYLSGIGVEPEYTTKKVDTTLFSTAGMHVTGDILGIPYDFDLPHFEIKGQVEVPQIKTSDTPGSGGHTGLRRTGGTGSGGLSNNYGSKKGGGGGGGGSSKGKDIKPLEEKDAKVDPYQKVNAELEKLADEYTEVDKAKDRMYGDRYRRAQEQEIKNLQQQNEKLEERVKISEKLIEAYRTGQDNPEYGIYLNGESLEKYGLADDDLDGIIDNRWERIEQLALDYQNKLAAANALAGEDRSEAEQEEFQRLSEIADEAYDLWNGAQGFIDDYESTYDKIRDDTEKIKENVYEIEDKVIDIWNYAKDAAKELGEFREDQVDLGETLATLWGDDAVKSLGFAFDRFTNMFEANEKSLADAIIDYQNRLSKATDENMKQWYQDQIDLAQKAMANGTSVLDLNMQRMNEIYKAIDEWKDSGRSELFGSNEKAMWEAFDEAWEDAVDYAKKLKGYIEDIHDNIGQVMDDMYDAMDRRNDLFDQVESQYEYLKDMTELVHGEKAYDMLERITRKQAQAGEERLKTLEEERKANHDMLEGLEEGSEEYLKALEKEQELDDDIRDIRRDITETYKEAKELANELAVQNWLDNFTADINGVEVPLEYAADQWERIKENADNYLDDLNRAWELEKLENEYLKLIDDAVDPNIQKQITKQMQEQLGYLREKDKLSEYDVKYANAQLEILQKTIALEDARANKNQMKLRRDSQGNYSYVYAANRNDVRDKENDLLDARMNGYNMSVEASRDATDDYFNHIQTMADRIRDAANDASLSAEQVEAITQDIIEYGYDYLRAKGEQLTTAQKNGIESYIQAAKELSELNAGNVLDMSRQLEEGLVDDLSMVTDVFHNAAKDWVEGPEGLNYAKTAADQMGRDVVRNVEDFVIAVGEANTNIEEPLDNIETQFIDANSALTNLTATAQDFYNFLEEKSGVVGQAAADLAEYQAALTDMNSKMNEYYDAWEQRGKELESEKAINSQLRIDMNNLQEEYETKLAEAQKQAGRGSGGSGSSSSTDKSNGSIVGYSGRYYSDSWGSGPSGNWFADQPGAVRISSFSRRSGYGDYNVHLETLNGGHLGWVKESQLFDTGGYTGAWGPGGKAAILHEKELVLNAQDTQNMLAAVSVVRGLVEMLKGSTFNLNNMSQRGFASSGVGNNVEQRVEITAEFPNVRSAADIEAALLNLSNNAYQYAYNKNEKFM